MPTYIEGGSKRAMGMLEMILLMVIILTAAFLVIDVARGKGDKIWSNNTNNTNNIW